MRPIDQVVAEVAASKRNFFWNIDDNIWGVNFKRSVELYREMAQGVRRKHWFGAGDLVKWGESGFASLERGGNFHRFVLQHF